MYKRYDYYLAIETWIPINEVYTDGINNEYAHIWPMGLQGGVLIIYDY